MEWTKIKPKHFLFNDIPLSQKGVLATILCLAAYLERMPTEREMIKNTQVSAYKALSKRLVTMGVNLEYIISKVLEDCKKIEHKKTINRETSARYRNSQKHSDTSLDTTDKIRLDKIRLDKNIKQQEPSADSSKDCVKAVDNYSEEFIRKAKISKDHGFNIYQLINKFYKQSKLREKLPEVVLESVLDEFIKRRQSIKESWPYFLRVLTSESQKHFSNRNENISKSNKRDSSFSIQDIMSQINRVEES